MFNSELRSVLLSLVKVNRVVSSQLRIIEVNKALHTAKTVGNWWFLPQI